MQLSKIFKWRKLAPPWGLVMGPPVTPGSTKETLAADRIYRWSAWVSMTAWTEGKSSAEHLLIPSPSLSKWGVGPPLLTQEQFPCLNVFTRRHPPATVPQPRTLIIQSPHQHFTDTFYVTMVSLPTNTGECTNSPLSQHTGDHKSLVLPSTQEIFSVSRKVNTPPDSLATVLTLIMWYWCKK